MPTHQQSNENILGALTDLFGGIVEIQHDNGRPENVTEKDMQFLQEDEIIYDFDDNIFCACAREREIRYGLGYDFERLRELFDGTANINARNDQGETLLFCAIDRCWDIELSLKLILFLLKRGANVRIPDRGGLSPLHLAARKGHVKLMADLLANGADIEYRDGLGRTPLFYAIQYDLGEWNYDTNYFDWVWKQDAIQFLLESGANIHACDNAGATVLDLRHRKEPIDVA